MSTLIKEAIYKGLRFKTAKGMATTEDLVSLDLPELDKIAIAVNRELKESETESFISNKTQANKALTLKLDVLKEIISDKLIAEEAAKNRKLKAARLAELKSVAASKMQEQLLSTKLEDVLAEIKALEGEA